MNTYSSLFPFRCNFIYSCLCIIVGLLFTGCVFNPSPATVVEPQGSQKILIQIVVQDDKSERRLSGAMVRLTIASTIFPSTRTDDNGLATFEVDESFIDNTGVLVVELDDYETNRQVVAVRNAEITEIWMVKEGATAVPRETPSITPIPPTPQPDDTSTPMPTATNTAIHTPTATATHTPMPTSNTDVVTVVPREGAETVYVLAGPDVVNERLGTLSIGEVIGRSSSNQWLQIVTSRGIQGWVADCEITLSSTNLTEIPVTWNGSVTPKDCSADSSGSSVSAPSSGGCVVVSLTHTEWPDRYFDDVLLSWSNVPSNAARLKLWVTGPNEDGETAFVIDPTFSDVDISYDVEKFKFEDGDFVPGASYTYVVQPFNASNEIICTTQGTFVP